MSDQPGFPGPSQYPPQYPPQQPAPPPSPFGQAPMQPPGQPLPPGQGSAPGYGPVFPPGPPTGPPPTAPWGGGGGGGWNPVPTPSPPVSRGRLGLFVVISLAVVGLSVATWLIVRDNLNKTQQAVDKIPAFSIPDFSIPALTIPALTIPALTIPAINVPPITVPLVTDSTVAAPSTVPATTAAESPPTTLAAPPVAVNLFDGTQSADVIAAVASARGASPLRILEVNLYPTYAFADVQDPNNPANVDEFGWRGAVQPPTPVQLTGGGDLETNLFSDSEVNWQAVPSLVAAALAQIPIEGAQVTHVHISRNLPFTPDVQIRVFVDGTRSSGYLDADAQGNIIAVNQS